MTTQIAPGVGANLLGQHAAERNQDATAYVGNLDPQTTEELLWELFVQAGPVVNVYVPKDRVTNHHQGYGFVEFRNEDDADYAIKVLNMIKFYGKAIKVNKATQDKKSLDVGANLFIGNLDPDVDEKLLHDTFSAFGFIVTNPKLMRESDTGNSRNFGFVSYDSFEASDAAIEAMHGQYLCNRQITVTYAYKKDTRGELHGTPAERVLAASNPGTKKSRPHTLFASGPPSLANASQVANGTLGAPVLPPQVSLAHIPATRPPPQVFPPMQMLGTQSWQGHQLQPGQLLAQPGVQPPPLPQHFRQPLPNVHPPLPPPHMAQMLNRPPPPPAGGMGAPYWRQPPPPQHMMGGNHPMQQMSMPLPPPPPTALPPPPPAMSCLYLD